MLFSRPLRAGAVGACGLLAIAVLAGPSAAMDLVELVKKVEHAVVRVDTDRGMGSGVLVDDRGYVFTNYHVIEGAKRAKITLRSGKEIPARGYLEIDLSRDLALLKIDKLPTPAAIGIAAAIPQTGQRVAAFGNPKGFSFTTSDGIVSAVRTGKEVSEIIGADVYRYLGYGKDVTWIQSTAAISNGNSGGPLVNMDGEVVGLNTWMHAGGQNINFAIGAGDLKVLLGKAVETAVLEFSDLPKRATAIELPLASKGPEEFKVSLPSGRVFSFATFDTRDVLSRLSSRKDAGGTAVITHPNGVTYAVAQHEKGILNGVTVAQYENKEPMAYAMYHDGKRHGLLKTWDEGGRPLLFAQYIKGRRHGFSCLFGQDASWMLIEYKYDNLQWVQLLSGYRPMEGFSTREDAEKNALAADLLTKADKLEGTLKTNEIAFRKQVSKYEQQLRRLRAAKLSPLKRARIQARHDERAAAGAAFTREIYRRAYGR